MDRRAPDTGGLPPGRDVALLCALFRRVTGQADIDENSDFFRAGGDSVSIMALAAELRQTGRELPLPTLLTARTPAAIAAAWRARPANEAGSTKPTLFVIPGTGGDAPRLALLRADWSDVLDCVLLDYPDWPVLAAPSFDMAALANGMISRMLQRAPSGPLLLAGYSLGGFVAWAIALRLASADRPVTALFILDSDFMEPVPAVAHASLSTRIRRLLKSTVTMLRAGDSRALTKLAGEFIGFRLVAQPKLLRLLARFRFLRLPPALRYRLRFSLGGELQARLVRAWQAADCAKPGFLVTGKVFVFRNESAVTNGDPSGLGWGTRCADLQTEKARGDHHSMLRLRGAGSIHERLPELATAIMDAGHGAAHGCNRDLPWRAI